ncbi:hypothetical protein PS918_05952 [Pseudomonas fluorescens]|uniref:DUF4214 domain-containing protein n=2 Tax=Pseudomonas fluorescens TaxID=294 RepID=A0A5E7V1H1_PSEFL|nr:hypothetical protein PS918_05952 [Pseudomonas fluorescens]
MAITSAQIQQLYVAYLGRAADKAGLDYWSKELNADKAVLTLENLRANFVNEQPEYAAIYGGLNRQDTVVKIYNNLFGRAPDAEGLAYWTTGGGASVNADLLLTAFVNGAGTKDSAVLANKVLVSEVYTATAGDKFLAADAKAIIAGVDDTGTSVGAALDKLTDGSLSGIAVPAGVAQLKAQEVATAAEKAFTDSKVTDLLALSKQLADLSKANAEIADVAASTNKTFTTVEGDLTAALTAARGALKTDTLTAKAVVDAKALTDARTAFVTDPAEKTTALDKINAYTAAKAAVAANTAANPADAKQAADTLTAFAANTNNAAVWNKAAIDSGLAVDDTAAAALTGQQVYDALKGADATTAAKINAAFGSITAYTAVKTLATKDAAAAKAAADFTKADTALAAGTGLAWKTAYNTDATTKAQLEASKALDALDNSYKAIDTAHTALETSKTDADTAVAGNTTLVKAVAAAGVTDKADVFYFDHKIATGDDISINFEAKDSLYLGNGYTLNKSATIDATGIHGANNSALEVFFFKAADGSIKAVVETAAEGNTTVVDNTLVANATDKVAVITLAGVTDVNQVTFANGIISHVA